MFKKTLIIALNESWTGISRLPEGLKRAGFSTYALCPQKSYLAKTRFLDGGFFYPTYTYSRSNLIYLWIIAAYFKFKPDIIIPGDEDSILALHRLANFSENLPVLNKLSKLIRASLTPKEFDELILSKSDFQAKCSQLGLRTPKNTVVSDLSGALEVARASGFPLVVKYDSGYGGSGVFICSNEDEMKKHFSEFSKTSLIALLKAKLKDLFFVSIFSGDKKISIQQYIEGTVGQSPFCAKDGVVFAANPMIRLQTFPGKTGPASVSAGFQNADIESYVLAVARALSYSGFGSVEYMIDAKSGLLYIIELNPRPTPTCHLNSSVVANDLGEMFYKGLNLEALNPVPFRPFTVAMFPGEKRRDPLSPYLISAYHDIPLDDPNLLKALDT
jgi:hypothetical protein